MLYQDIYDEYMGENFEAKWDSQTPSDKDKLWQATLDTWKKMEMGDDEYGLMSLAIVSAMDKKDQLLYRTALAEEGQEYTPDQVEMLCESIQYTFTLYNENNPIIEDEEGDYND